MSLDFKSGNYTVETGKTFTDPDDPTHGYYSFRFTSKLDPTMTSRTASLRQEDGVYFADWTMADSTLSYEGVKGNLQELECLLIFDEETQTFTVERPTLKTNLKKRKKKSTESTNSKQKAKSKSTSASNANVTQQQHQQQSPLSLALPPQQKPKDTQGTATSPHDDDNDLFDDDFLRDMDEVLNSNNDDDDDDDNNDEFETITTPHISNDSIQTGNVPLSNSPQPVTTSSPGSQPQSSTPGNRRRHVLKMASAPIRRLDSSPPTPAPTTSSSTIIPPPPSSVSNKRPRAGGKTISAETLAARRKAASAIRSDSSSGSSSSGSDSSSDDGSGSSGTSGTDSDDDDDDMDILAANISRGLSEDESTHPPTNYIRNSPNPLTPSSNRGSNGTPGPTSLRDLLGKGDQRDDDNVSSSGSSDDDG